MAKCEFCGKRAGSLEMYTDFFGDTFNVCQDCLNSILNHKCRKCGEIINETDSINGLCNVCLQGAKYEEEKRKTEVRAGLAFDDDMLRSSDIILTEEDIETYQLTDSKFSPKDFEKNRVLRYIWIKIKFNASGIFDNDIIMTYAPDVEKILDRSLHKLVGIKCRFLIVFTPEGRKNIRENTASSLIDTEGDVYILKHDVE